MELVRELHGAHNGLHDVHHVGAVGERYEEGFLVSVPRVTFHFDLQPVPVSVRTA